MAASGWPKMPKTPHSSLNLSNMLFRPPACAKYRSIAVDHDPLGVVDRHDRSRSAPPTAIRSRLPPVWPMTRAGTPAAAARCEHRRHVAPASTETTTRDADSPNSAAATFDRAVARDARRRRSRPRRRCRRCRSSTRRASPRGRRRSSRAPTAPAARPPASTSSACSARSAVEIERRRHAAHQIVHDLQVLAAAELAAAVAEQDDRIARLLEPPARPRDRRARAGRRRR